MRWRRARTTHYNDVCPSLWLYRWVLLAEVDRFFQICVYMLEWFCIEFNHKWETIECCKNSRSGRYKMQGQWRKASSRNYTKFTFLIISTSCILRPIYTLEKRVMSFFCFVFISFLIHYPISFDCLSFPNFQILTAHPATILITIYRIFPWEISHADK